ncbi:MerR family transcriptional regulator [Enterococcus sp. CWB-B31]|uniref:MerR family transcriptional regulator n=1 Tax=Enterococcus sp. CWB-B31 TaxID=2885159 RepID=UPI001E4D9252|nr:MerR family transcriptional regulator [Enterococcus sp. CWB-B31]MCB5953603.1 MerR family transcriptional regulator [Enterococcus sp. CWB-B31]
MKTMWTINEAAKMTHLSKDTIRYYEKEKLIFPERKDNNYRFYSQNDLLKLKYIVVMKYAHFSLKEIKAFLILFDQELSEACNLEGQELLKKKITDLEKTIVHYQSILDLLKQIPYPENFQELLKYWQKNNAVHFLDHFIEAVFEEIKEEADENY